jgi:protein-tyrosine phosphatase
MTEEEFPGIPAGARPEARALRVAEVRNVRDLGGLEADRGTIRSGLLLRGAALHELTAEGADVLAELGLRTVIDLRMAVERRQEPSRLPEHTQLAGVTELQMPLVPDFEDCPDSPDGSYRFMVERGATTIGAVLRKLAEPGALPALVHCTAGKDRTGIIVAALLSTLGVPIAQMHADYMRSNEALGDRLIYPAETWALDAALEHMAELGGGSVEGFLERQGVDGPTLAALHETLLPSS